MRLLLRKEIVVIPEPPVSDLLACFPLSIHASVPFSSSRKVPRLANDFIPRCFYVRNAANKQVMQYFKFKTNLYLCIPYNFIIFDNVYGVSQKSTPSQKPEMGQVITVIRKILEKIQLVHFGINNHKNIYFLLNWGSLRLEFRVE